MTTNNDKKEGRDSAGRFLHGHKHGWQPGQSGNPSGKNKGIRVSDHLKRIVEEDMIGVEGVDKRTIGEAMARIGIEKALDGDIHFWRYIIDRLDGKIADKLEVSSVGENEAIFSVMTDEELHTIRTIYEAAQCRLDEMGDSNDGD